MSTQTSLTSVTSDPKPQQGQKNRSSGNFSTENAPADTKSLIFNIATSNPNYDSIVFNVMEDKSMQPDPIVYSNLRNGSVVAYQSSRSLYIADPSGAGGETFVVEVSASSS
ncbi:MAG: DeoR family transcriptional regulator [Planctomycetota bacterium]